MDSLRRSIKKSGGYAEDSSDSEVVNAVKLAKRIFTELAGGVVIAALKRFVEQGRIEKDELL